MRTTQPKIGSLYGKEIHWTFTQGSTAGASYVHVFHEDGSVEFGTEGTEKGKRSTSRMSSVVRLGEDLFMVSYLGDSGYTLTVALDTEKGEMTAFASNGKEWSEHTGTFEIR